MKVVKEFFSVGHKVRKPLAKIENVMKHVFTFMFAQTVKLTKGNKLLL